MPQIRPHRRLMRIPESNWDQFPKRSEKKIVYHDRSGHPDIHIDEKGYAYIMVRAPGGEGTKRYYLTSKGKVLEEDISKKD
jgi:hypothetical protein